MLNVYLFVAFTTVAHTTIVPDSSSIDAVEHRYRRFIQFPVDGNTHKNLIDLKVKPNLELVKEIIKTGDINKYLLFTRLNPNSPQYLSTNDAQSLTLSYFDPSYPTVVIIHGWLGKPKEDLDRLIRDALLETSTVNVIVVSWHKVAALDYASAVFGVPSVGRNVGRFLAFVNAVSGAPFTSMHLAGHSLGAHVAGNAGRELAGKVGRITGLDPAGPLWYLNSKGLQPQDAIYVEAIHTNAFGLGISYAVGDVDFFPNGGSFQPGCISETCHHSRSYELFAATIKNSHLVGVKCSSYLQMTLNNCSGDRFPMGNNDMQKRGAGIYRLKTESSYPY